MQQKGLSYSSLTVATLFALSLLAGQPRRADAGCGCQKTPPAPAVVFPNATYPGATVTLAHPALQDAQTYTVTFTSMSGESATVSTQAVTKRDIADGQYKPQLTVSLPSLPLGPAAITILQNNTATVVTLLEDSFFTVVPQPLVASAQTGKYRFLDFQAAVGRDGVVYVSLDLTSVTMPLVFQAQAKGYPLRFTNKDAVFYNTQGYLMQVLDESMPGLFSIAAADSTRDSDLLQYSRHEFNTFYLQHQERQPHEVDPTDGNWHVDGTRHIDHNHLVLAIAGRFSDGSRPAPGATPPFTLELCTFSLFHQGLVGADAIELTDSATIDSYTPMTGGSINGGFGSAGNILSNGAVNLNLKALVKGDATAKSFSVKDQAKIQGKQIFATVPTAILSVGLPKDLPSLGSIIVSNRKTMTLTGPGSFLVNDLRVENGALTVDNTAGPVTLYVTGQIYLADKGRISITDLDPEKFAIYAVSSNPISLVGSSQFYGVLHAPLSPVDVSGSGEFYGALAGKSIKVRGRATIHYDSSLTGKSGQSGSTAGGWTTVQVQ